MRECGLAGPRRPPEDQGDGCRGITLQEAAQWAPPGEEVPLTNKVVDIAWAHPHGQWRTRALRPGGLIEERCTHVGEPTRG